MQYLRANSTTKVLIGPVVEVANGYVPVTTLDVSTADEAEVLKHDAAAVTSISGNTFVAIANADGYYNLTLTAAQTDTEGRLTVVVNDDNLCLPVRHDFMVVNANVFDSLFAAATTDYLQTDTTQWLGTAVTTSATTTKPEVDVAGINDSALAAVRLALSAGQIIPGTVSDAVLTPTTTVFAADDITEVTADHYNSRVIIWTSGALAGQATAITDYSFVSSEGNFTVVAMTEAPANNDTFIII